MGRPAEASGQDVPGNRPGRRRPGQDVGGVQPGQLRLPWAHGTDIQALTPVRVAAKYRHRTQNSPAPIERWRGCCCLLLGGRLGGLAALGNHDRDCARCYEHVPEEAQGDHA